MDTFQKLQQLKQLLDAGAITQEEYDAKKAEVLSAPGEPVVTTGAAKGKTDFGAKLGDLKAKPGDGKTGKSKKIIIIAAAAAAAVAVLVALALIFCVSPSYWGTWEGNIVVSNDGESTYNNYLTVTISMFGSYEITNDDGEVVASGTLKKYESSSDDVVWEYICDEDYRIFGTFTDSDGDNMLAMILNKSGTRIYFFSK